MTLGRTAARAAGVVAVVLAGLGGLAVDLAAQAPTVTGVSVNLPTHDSKQQSFSDNSQFWPSETIRVTVAFSDSVDVTGTPRVELGIDTCPGSDCFATYASGTGTDSLVFAYRVRRGDSDTDGISIAADALKLNGGTIIATSGGAAADLDLGTHAFSDDTNRKVLANAGRSITNVALNSPPSGDTFVNGDTVVVTFTFNRTVRFTGASVAANGAVTKGRITIGNRVREGDYLQGHPYPNPNNRDWIFRYIVRANDADADGISIVGEGIRGGSMENWTDRYVNRQAIVNSANHKVDGSQGPPGVFSGSLTRRRTQRTCRATRSRRR